MNIVVSVQQEFQSNESPTKANDAALYKQSPLSVVFAAAKKVAVATL